MKLQKYLATAGVASRRKSEDFIARGLVTVNGEIAHIGQIIDSEKDQIEVKNEAITEVAESVYYKINKPRGVVTTCVSQGDTGILDIVDIPERVFPIGRLDKETTGLILLTNDGRLSNYLMHPRYEHEKEYIVEVYGRIEDDTLLKLGSGSIDILGSRVQPATVKRLSSGTFSIVLKEGKNRQIRRMVEVVGHMVKKLKRIRIENIHLGNLDEGEYILLTPSEQAELLERTVFANSKSLG